MLDKVDEEPIVEEDPTVVEVDVDAFITELKEHLDKLKDEDYQKTFVRYANARVALLSLLYDVETDWGHNPITPPDHPIVRYYRYTIWGRIYQKTVPKKKDEKGELEPDAVAERNDPNVKRARKYILGKLLERERALVQESIPAMAPTLSWTITAT